MFFHSLIFLFFNLFMLKTLCYIMCYIIHRKNSIYIYRECDVNYAILKIIQKNWEEMSHSIRNYFWVLNSGIYFYSLYFLLMFCFSTINMQCFYNQ